MMRSDAEEWIATLEALPEAATYLRVEINSQIGEYERPPLMDHVVSYTIHDGATFYFTTSAEVRMFIADWPDVLRECKNAEEDIL